MRAESLSFPDVWIMVTSTASARLASLAAIVRIVRIVSVLVKELIAYSHIREMMVIKDIVSSMTKRDKR